MELEKKDATSNSPFIEFDHENKIVHIRGNSYPENSYEFYDFLLVWIKEYLEKTSNSLRLNMEIIYMNSGTSKVFYDLFSLLTDFKNAGKEIEIHWIYDKENCSAEENGEDYQEDFEALEIRLVEKEDE